MWRVTQNDLYSYLERFSDGEFKAIWSGIMMKFWKNYQPVMLAGYDRDTNRVLDGIRTDLDMVLKYIKTGRPHTKDTRAYTVQ